MIRADSASRLMLFSGDPIHAIAIAQAAATQDAGRNRRHGWPLHGGHALGRRRKYTTPRQCGFALFLCMAHQARAPKAHAAPTSGVNPQKTLAQCGIKFTT